MNKTTTKAHKYQIAVTLVATVEAASEQDARDQFDDGEYDSEFELTDNEFMDVRIELVAAE